MYVECNVIACWPLQYALMFRKMWLLLPIAAALSGCADGSFGRFMDHPIASWLPVEDLGEPGHHPFEPPPRRADQDKECYEIAYERTNVLPDDGYAPDARPEIFERSYADCTAEKQRYGVHR